MKQDEYSTANKLWNAGATVVQQLNPGGPEQRQIIRPQPTYLKAFCRSLIKSKARPTGMQLKRAVNSVGASSQRCYTPFVTWNGSG